MHKEMLLMDEQRKEFPVMESTGEDVKIAEMTTKDLECDICLFHKAAARFERTNCNLGRG